MTTAEGWTAAVRDLLAPGRLLPLGSAGDRAWITEHAARQVLDPAATAVRGLVPGELRFEAAPAAGDGGRAAPAPPGALAPGPLRISTGFGVVMGDRPLPELAEELRTALLTAAREGLGLPVTTVDLEVTELLDAAPAEVGPAAPLPGRPSPAAEDATTLAVLRVEGVAGVTDAWGPPVHRGPDGVRVELAVTSGHRPLDVARAVRKTVAAAAGKATAVTVLVSELR
ncbi:hypothetical protein [Streptomyces sp. bgisy060]|uniref:hypothetical protein n=1 Tax=Streptomyces sp. bgisy060 TaxID=3413775 RepID=UPI003EBBC630